MRYLWLAIAATGCGFQANPGMHQIDASTIDALVDAPPDMPQIDGTPGHAFKKVFTTDPLKVAGNMTNFPVWVKLTGDNDLKLHADTGDIFFTTSTGTPLEWELQRWNKATGDLEAWVRADLADLTPSTFEIRYGDPGPAHAPNPVMAFSNAFLAVWHMEDPLAGQTAVADVLNLRPGTAMNGPTSTTGKLGRGIAFDGNDDRISFTNPFTGNTKHTISAWVDVVAPANGFSAVFVAGTLQNGQTRFMHTSFPGVAVGFGGNDLTPNNTAIAGMGPKLIHWVYDPNGNAGDTTLYINGVQVASMNHGGNIGTTGTSGFLGWAPPEYGPGGNTPNPLHGTLDEVRISNTNRNRQWCDTEFANQSSPGTFYSVSAEMMVP